jgi:hypothetical protein
MPRSTDIQMTDGLCLLVRAVLALPERPGDSYAGLARLAPLPSRVLELVAEEVMAAHDRGEINRRPTCAQVSDMCLAAMQMRHRLMMLRGSHDRGGDPQRDAPGGGG